LSRSEASDDLRWTAARYVLGELPPDEAQQFEDRLQDDQPACDAVAEAVLLLHAGASLKPVVRRAPSKRIMAWASTAAAVCLLVGVAALFMPRATPLADATAVQAGEPDDAWILALPELLEAQTAVIETADVPVDDDADSLIHAVADETDADLPGWLILATSKEGSH
jgi:hypothetical protein